ncbi:hypothetical protein Q9L58_004397 [Maublancomyces gigas]|uniref:Transposase n=1 Tax=Discina gigas TaxID=1032678 RepID=A0ABR3GL64_9PEZI
MLSSTSSTVKSEADTEQKGRQGTKRGKEVGIGRRGAAVALAKTGLPVRDIAKLIQVPSSTVSGIVQHAEQMVKINGGDALDDINLKPKKRSGRPKKWTAEDRLVVVELCTRDETQRSKAHSTLAKECPFPIDEHAIKKILSEAGYDHRRDISGDIPTSPQ